MGYLKIIAISCVGVGMYYLIDRKIREQYVLMKETLDIMREHLALSEQLELRMNTFENSMRHIHDRVFELDEAVFEDENDGFDDDVVYDEYGYPIYPDEEEEEFDMNVYDDMPDFNPDDGENGDDDSDTDGEHFGNYISRPGRRVVREDIATSEL